MDVAVEQTPPTPPRRRLGALAPARSRADQLADLVDARIDAEGLEPGACVGTLEELREQTGFARATVSEAVRLLRDRGVLEIRPGRGGGLFVAKGSPIVRLRRTLLSIEENPEAVREAIELRDHLEALIDVAAARHRTPGDVAALAARLDALRLAESWAEFMQANWALHERIALICPNAMARAVYIGTLGHLSATRSASAVAGGDVEPAYRDERLEVHRALVEAIAAGDVAGVLQAVDRHQIPT